MANRHVFIRDYVLNRAKSGAVADQGTNAARTAADVWDQYLGPPKTKITLFKPEAKAS